MTVTSWAPGTVGEFLMRNPPSTLLILPCSVRKTAGGHEVSGPTIMSHLPGSLAGRLVDARRAVADSARVNEDRLLPAWERYSPGLVYKAAGDAVQAADGAGAHVLIVSGAYGIVLASEPIGNYSARFEGDDWPARVDPSRRCPAGPPAVAPASGPAPCRTR